MLHPSLIYYFTCISKIRSIHICLCQSRIFERLSLNGFVFVRFGMKVVVMIVAAPLLMMLIGSIVVMIPILRGLVALFSVLIPARVEMLLVSIIHISNSSIMVDVLVLMILWPEVI